MDSTEFYLELFGLIITVATLFFMWLDMRSNTKAVQAVLISSVLGGMSLAEISAKIEKADNSKEGDSAEVHSLELMLNQIELYAAFENNGMMKNKRLASFMDDDFLSMFDSHKDYFDKNDGKYPEIREMAERLRKGKKKSS